MATISQSRWAIVCAGMALVQLAAAVTAGFSFIETGYSVLTSISCGLTCIILLVNRWFFRGWRERVFNPRGVMDASGTGNACFKNESFQDALPHGRMETIHEVSSLGVQRPSGRKDA